jgi:plasmid stabilization system protein ParE
MRVVFHYPYAIYYRPTPDAVVIMRIVHSARDIKKIFKGENE